MRKSSVLITLGIVLCCLVFALGGCAQMGETEDEARIRHIRNNRVTRQQMERDVEKVLLLDEPSRLSETRAP